LASELGGQDRCHERLALLHGLVGMGLEAG
jgi:hypothetical protein